MNKDQIKDIFILLGNLGVDLVKGIILLGILFYGFQYFTMDVSRWSLLWRTEIALECNWRATDERDWFIIKKARFYDDSDPRLFMGTDNSKHHTGDKIYKPYNKVLSIRDEYIFTNSIRYNSDTRKDEPGKEYYALNRINLNMRHFVNLRTYIADCTEISENEFYENIENQIDGRNKKYKF